MRLTGFSLEIELGNDAMQDANDVARAVELLGVALFDIDPDTDDHPIRDLNGNTVGHWRFTLEEDSDDPDA